MHIVGAQFIRQLGSDRVGFGDLFRFEAFAFEHVVKIGVAAKVQLIGALEFHAARFE